MRQPRSRTVHFKNRQRNVQCPACLDRNALNMVGRPAFVNGVRLSAGCEVCGGKGRVDAVERVNGWPKPDTWVAYREDTPRRKAYRPPVLDPGAGVVTYRAALRRSKSSEPQG